MNINIDENTKKAIQTISVCLVAITGLVLTKNPWCLISLVALTIFE